MIASIDIKHLWGGKTVALSCVNTSSAHERVHIRRVLICRAWNAKGFARRYAVLLPTARTICEASAECGALPKAAAAKPALAYVAKPNAKNAIALATNLSARFGDFDDSTLKRKNNIQL